MHHLKMSQQVNRSRRRRAGLSKLITLRVINTKIKWKQAKLPWVPPQIKSWKNSKDSAWKKPSRLARRGTMLAFLNSRVITRLIAGTKKYVRGKKTHLKCRHGNYFHLKGNVKTVLRKLCKCWAPMQRGFSFRLLHSVSVSGTASHYVCCLCKWKKKTRERTVSESSICVATNSLSFGRSFLNLMYAHFWFHLLDLLQFSAATPRSVFKLFHYFFSAHFSEFVISAKWRGGRVGWCRKGSEWFTQVPDSRFVVFAGEFLLHFSR